MTAQKPRNKRSERLFEMIDILRDGRRHRAQDMADRLGVTIRTVYRDMDTLIASGVPIEGERGLGYKATAAITLPPLNLTMTELEALHLGIAIVGNGADDELKAAAASLSSKIDAVLPEDRATRPTGWGFSVYPFADAARGFDHMPHIRASIRARQKLSITYRDEANTQATATIRPLKLDYWGRVWTVMAWNESIADFETLRVDRIDTLKVLPQLFVEEDGKSLADYLARSDGR